MSYGQSRQAGEKALKKFAVGKRCHEMCLPYIGQITANRLARNESIVNAIEIHLLPQLDERSTRRAQAQVASTLARKQTHMTCVHDEGVQPKHVEGKAAHDFGVIGELAATSSTSVTR